MNRDGNKGKVFLKRSGYLALGMLFLMVLMLARLYYLQVYQADKYNMMAESNRIGMRISPSTRGLIFDRNNIPLAVNNQYYQALVISEKTAGGVKKTLNTLKKLVPVSDERYSYVQREVKRHKAFIPVTVVDNLSWEDMAKIQVNAPDLPGIIIDEGLSRYYPYPYDTAHILGYMGLVDDGLSVQDRQDPLLEIPNFKMGKTGIEAYFDKKLRGEAGSRQVEVNVVGREVRELYRISPLRGDDITLSIDLRLQKAAKDAMNGLSGAAIVVDVNTGEIMALVSSPSFDANMFTEGISRDDWNKLSKDILKPMTNKAVSGEYSPGSTFKMIVALAALEEGIITADTEIDCEGYLDIGNHRFHCWKHSGHGSINLKRALAESCDVYFYEIAKLVGVDKIAKMSKRFGLGAKENIELPFEKSGLIPTQNWKRRVFGEPWQPGETLLTGIGQSYIKFTPLQMVMMTARLVNGGNFITPTLLKHNNDSPVYAYSIGINKRHLDIVKKGMDATVNESYGTASRSQIDPVLGRMCGKTGTTQVKRITREERESQNFTQKEIPWHERNHALFVGYAPANKPKYAITVVVEHGGGGGAVAAPIASRIMEYALLLDKQKEQVATGKNAKNNNRGGKLGNRNKAKGVNQ